MPLAHYPDSSGAFPAAAKEPVAVDNASVAVPERQGAGALEEGVSAKHILAGLVRNDLKLAVASFEKVPLHDGGRVGHRLVAVSDANRFTAILSEWRTGAKMVLFEEMKIPCALHFHLNGGSFIRLAGEVTAINTIRGAEKMDEILVRAARHRTFRQAQGAAAQPNAVSSRTRPVEVQPVNDDVFSFDGQRGTPAQHDASPRPGLQRERPADGPGGAELNALILPNTVFHQKDIARPRHARRPLDISG
jgi:hypothetical protein